MNEDLQNNRSIKMTELPKKTSSPKSFILFGIILSLLLIIGFLTILLVNQNTLMTLNQNSNSSFNIISTPKTEPTISKFNSDYISLDYPDNWFMGELGGGYNIDQFQIHNIPQDKFINNDGSLNDRISIIVEVSTVEMFNGINLDKQREELENPNRKNLYDSTIVTKGKFKDIDALFSVDSSNKSKLKKYIDTIWLIKNERFYRISLSILAENNQSLDLLRIEGEKAFSRVKDSLIFK